MITLSTAFVLNQRKDGNNSIGDALSTKNQLQQQSKGARWTRQFVSLTLQIHYDVCKVYYELIHNPNVDNLSFDRILLLNTSSNYIDVSKRVPLTYHQQLVIPSDASYFHNRYTREIRTWIQSAKRIIKAVMKKFPTIANQDFGLLSLELKIWLPCRRQLSPNSTRHLL